MPSRPRIKYNEETLRVTCPTCVSAPLMRCLTRTGYECPPHVTRINKALEVVPSKKPKPSKRPTYNRAILSVTCPTCNKGPKERCTPPGGLQGERIYPPHATRVKLSLNQINHDIDRS